MLYFAILHKNKDNQYEVTFPDLEPYAATYGDTLDEAIQSAYDSLTGYLLTAEDFNEKVPKPTLDPQKFDIKKADLVLPVKVNLELERAKEKNKLVKKTLNIPEYLNIRAKEAGINFSQLLTEALQQKLNV